MLIHFYVTKITCLNDGNLIHFDAKLFYLELRLWKFDGLVCDHHRGTKYSRIYVHLLIIFYAKVKVHVK